MSNAFSRKLVTFSTLSVKDQRDVDSLATPLQLLDARKDLAKAHGDIDVLHVVMTGWVGEHIMLRDGGRQIVRLLLPGDAFEPYAFLTDQMEHSLRTFTRAAIAKVPARAVRDLAAGSPEIAEALRRQTLANIDIQRQWIVGIGRRSAAGRVAHFLCEVTARLAAIGLSDGLECEMPLTQVDLADIVGLTDVYVNRVLQDLRAANLIEMRNRRLRIVDRRRLADMAVFDPGYLHQRRA